MSDVVQKDESMVMQKRMIGDHFTKLARAKERGQKVVYTFVPGNLTELMHAFDVLPVYPEINALQSGMRKQSARYIAEAEKTAREEAKKKKTVGNGGKKADALKEEKAAKPEPFNQQALSLFDGSEAEASTPAA